MIKSVKGYKIGMVVGDDEGWKGKIDSFPNRTSVILKGEKETPWSKAKLSISNIRPTIGCIEFTSEFRLSTNIGNEDYNYKFMQFRNNKFIIKYFKDMVKEFNKDLRGNKPRVFKGVSRKIGNKFIKL